MEPVKSFSWGSQDNYRIEKSLQNQAWDKSHQQDIEYQKVKEDMLDYAHKSGGTEETMTMLISQYGSRYQDFYKDHPEYVDEEKFSNELELKNQRSGH